MDKDVSGDISMNEFFHTLAHRGVQFSEKQKASLLEALDRDEDGSITYKELVEARRQMSAASRPDAETNFDSTTTPEHIRMMREKKQPMRRDNPSSDRKSGIQGIFDESGKSGRLKKSHRQKQTQENTKAGAVRTEGGTLQTGDRGWVDEYGWQKGQTLNSGARLEAASLNVDMQRLRRPLNACTKNHVTQCKEQGKVRSFRRKQPSQTSQAVRSLLVA